MTPHTTTLDLPHPAAAWPSGAQRTRVRPSVVRDVLRVATVNTHRGGGPTVPYLLQDADAAAAERVRLLHATRAYAFHIAEWLRARADRYHVVGLQEVFHGVLGLALPGRARQRDYYRALAGYDTALAHRVGFAAFRYENVLLSRLPEADVSRIEAHLPCPVFYLAACGFTLAPLRFGERVVWVGNTHLHAYNPRARARQAAAIAREVRRLGDVPVVLLGDLNTVPPGCKDGDFPHGDRDVRSYRGDRTLRVLGRAGLRTVTHTDERRFWTYPVGAPNRTLDYVLASRHFEIETYRVIDDFGLSDHYPVEAELRLVD